MPSRMVRFLMAVMSTAGLVVLGCLLWAMFYGTRTDVLLISMGLVAVVNVIFVVGVMAFIDIKEEKKR